jgi:D-alanyl-D-alanine carboxypeptidase (penicillin-binding protein 5/6)
MAGRTFVGAARRGGHTLVVTLMRTTDSSEAAAAALLNWGFDTIGELEPVGTLVEPAEPEDATPATAAPSDVDVDPAADVDPAVDTRTLAGAVSAGSSQPTVPPLAWALLLVGVVALGVTALRSRAHARARSSGRHAR